MYKRSVCEYVYVVGKNKVMMLMSVCMQNKTISKQDIFGNNSTNRPL